MKKVKKIFAILMTLAMIMGLGMTAMAAPADVTGITSNITISGLSAGVSTDVSVYRFATLQYNADNNEYTWDIASWAKDYVTLNAAKTAYEIDEDKAAEFKAKAIATNDPEYSYTAAEETAVAGTSVTISGVEIGGFVIVCNDSKAAYAPLFVANTYNRDGSPVEGKPVAQDVTVYAKSQDHGFDKTQTDDFQQIGAEVEYTVNGVFPMAENADGDTLTSFEIIDEPTGLAIKLDTVNVTVEGVSPEDLTKITKSLDNGNLVVNFDELVGKNYDGRPITITYKAIVTDTKYNNNVHSNLPATEYKPDKTEGKNGSLTLTKVDAEMTTKTLAGAQFKVYDLGNGNWDPDEKGTPMNLIWDDSKQAYRPVLTDEIGTDTVEVNENGILEIVGLDEGNYHFEEVKAPSGYSINTEGYTAKVTQGETATENVDFNFLDTKLASLPSTGGIGTTIFTIGGIVIMIAAAALFFANRRKNNAQ